MRSEDNPADLASRGFSPKESEKVHLWFEGPAFLKESEEAWRGAETEYEVEENDVELKVEKKVNAVKISDCEVLETLEKRISSWHKMKRVIAWMLRFASK